MDALVEKYAHEPAPRVPGAVERVAADRGPLPLRDRIVGPSHR